MQTTVKLVMALMTLSSCSIGYRKPNTRACTDPNLAKVKSGVSFTMCDGSIGVGTNTSNSSLPNCTKDGETACVAQGKFIVADTTKFNASNIPTGLTIAGIAGTNSTIVYSNCTSYSSTACIVTTAANCTTDAQVGCVTTSTFVAADTTAISTYDLRQGKTFGGISGARKDCRNGMRATSYDYNSGTPGDPTGIDNAAHTNAAQGDWWNTIDDGLGAALPNPASWSSAYFCNGSQITDVSNSQSWLVPSNSPLYCSATTCTSSFNFTNIFYEPYSGLYLTNVLSNASGAQDNLGTSWDESVLGCYNLSSGDGVGKWRLPTLFELQQLEIGGISLVNTTLFASRISNNSFWSATTQSGLTSNAFYQGLLSSYTATTGKTSNGTLICVR